MYDQQPYSLEHCLSGLAQAISGHDKVSALFWMMRSDDTGKGAGLALAHRLMDIAKAQGHVPAQRLMANSLTGRTFGDSSISFWSRSSSNEFGSSRRVEIAARGVNCLPADASPKTMGLPMLIRSSLNHEAVIVSAEGHFAQYVVKTLERLGTNFTPAKGEWSGAGNCVWAGAAGATKGPGTFAGGVRPRIPPGAQLHLAARTRTQQRQRENDLQTGPGTRHFRR